MSADNQQESNKSISDQYLTGFVEGEGCFYVGFSKRNDLPLGWQIITEFHLSQNPGGKNILYFFTKRLKCGYIKRNHPKSKRDKTWVLIIKNRDDLNNKLIPFFEKNPLQTSKFEDYKIFKQTLSLVEKKKHLTMNGFKQIVNLVFSSKRETRKRYSKKEILRSSETTRKDLD
ncbi:LAGLIDADG family homing endonuclease [Patescibacteria group bacterium]|nr:LAGLIDADG family homing endonuclease [Patescibacteria group bacterium]